MQDGIRSLRAGMSSCLLLFSCKSARLGAVQQRLQALWDALACMRSQRAFSITSGWCGCHVPAAGAGVYGSGLEALQGSSLNPGVACVRLGCELFQLQLTHLVADAGSLMCLIYVPCVQLGGAGVTTACTHSNAYGAIRAADECVLVYLLLQGYLCAWRGRVKRGDVFKLRGSTKYWHLLCDAHRCCVPTLRLTVPSSVHHVHDHAALHIVLIGATCPAWV